VWEAKLLDYVTNQLLKGGNIKHDLGRFNPFPAHILLTRAMVITEKKMASSYQYEASNSGRVLECFSR